MLTRNEEDLTDAINQLKSASFKLQILSGQDFEGDLADACERWGDEVQLAAIELREMLNEHLTTQEEVAGAD